MARNGADGLYNHTIQHLVEGVSEQINEARRETQVEDMVNCIPHVSRGVMRRNPVDFVGNLRDAKGNLLDTSKYFVYTYDRGTEGEQYLILIGHLVWHVYNINTLELLGSSTATDTIGGSLFYLDTKGKHPKEAFSLVTVGDYTWINNNQITTQMTTNVSVGEKDDHKKTAIYWVKKTDNRIVKQDPSTGDATIRGLSYYVKVGDAAYRVFSGNITPSFTAFASLELNYQIAGEMAGGLNGGSVEGSFTYQHIDKYSYLGWWPDPFVNPVKVYTYDNEYYTAIPDNDLITEGAKTTYVWDGKIVYDSENISYTSRDFVTSFSTNKGVWSIYKIRKTIKRAISVGSSKGSWKANREFVYNRSLDPDIDMEWEDGAGGTASLGIKGVARRVSDLPSSLPASMGEVIIKIDSSEEDESGEEYWMKWNGELWKETKQPGLYDEIDPTTMPHVFLRDADGSFKFGYYGEFSYEEATKELRVTRSSAWTDRLVGDLNTAPNPSFIGKKISSIFFHNNRLGFLSDDNIIMSELGRYENFWPTTIRTIPETDPIDITAATKDVTTLKSAASISGSLLLFSETSQFILTSTGGALTPQSAVINNVSSYNYNPLAPTGVIGNKIFFSSESGNGTQIFDFELNSVLTTGSENVAANNRSLHIPTYLPTGINTIIGHSILGYILLHSFEDPKNIYVLNTLTVDGQGAQSAFHRWEFEHEIVGINIVKNSLNIVFKNTSNNTLLVTNMSLDIPADISTVDYTDDFDGNRTSLYDSKIILSKWQIKDPNGLGTPRGRLQIRTAQIAASKNSEYTVKLVRDDLLEPTTEWLISSGYWVDTGVWDDTSNWLDGFPYTERIYDNDRRVTVASNAANTFFIFQNNRTNRNKGFELATINLEGFFRQRSTRY